MSTCICHREPRGWGFKSSGKYDWFCSRACLNGFVRLTDKGKKKMPSLTRDEVAAIEFAATQAGEYLDSIGKTDLSIMTPEEWMTLNETIFMAASWKLGEIISEKEVPF